MTAECPTCGGSGVVSSEQGLDYYGVCQTCQGSGWIVQDWYDGQYVRPAEGEFDDDLSPEELDWWWDD